jgi:hypothetical protein
MGLAKLTGVPSCLLLCTTPCTHHVEKSKHAALSADTRPAQSSRDVPPIIALEDKLITAWASCAEAMQEDQAPRIVTEAQEATSVLHQYNALQIQTALTSCSASSQKHPAGHLAIVAGVFDPDFYTLSQPLFVDDLS